MAFITGMIVLDAPASALNNAGADAGARADNTVVVKRIKTPQGILPYVSAQAFRYWLRQTLETNGNGWVSAPVFREGKIAYPDANPVKNWDDDLFGYMRAPSSKADAIKDEAATPLEKDRQITRVSPFRVGTLVAIAPSPVISDFGTMSRQEGNPVPFEHEFYRAHLQGLFSLDLTCAGTFFDMERAGYRNLDTNRRQEAKDKGCQEVTVRKQRALRLPIEERRKRVSTLISALAVLDGGAKQALHYTDVTPAIVFLAVMKNGNNPFYRVLRASKTHQTEFHKEAFEEIIKVYQEDFLSDIFIGWAKGFLDEERMKMEALIDSHANKSQANKPDIHLDHPRPAIQGLASSLATATNEANPDELKSQTEAWFV